MKALKEFQIIKKSNTVGKMGYRTLEISTSCEIHIKEGQLEVTSKSDNGSWSKYKAVNHGFINTKSKQGFSDDIR